MAADDDVGEDRRGDRGEQQEPAQDREGVPAGALVIAGAADELVGLPVARPCVSESGTNRAGRARPPGWPTRPPPATPSARASRTASRASLYDGDGRFAGRDRGRPGDPVGRDLRRGRRGRRARPRAPPADRDARQAGPRGAPDPARRQRLRRPDLDLRRRGLPAARAAGSRRSAPIGRASCASSASAPSRSTRRSPREAGASAARRS